jgi:hypothetical protein
MSVEPKWMRPEPARFAPYRNGWSTKDQLKQVTEMATTTVEEAVNLGYAVIEDNIERGRSYARSRNKNQTSHETPDELLELSAKVIQMGRDFSLAYFDLVEKTLCEVMGYASRNRPSTDENTHSKT